MSDLLVMLVVFAASSAIGYAMISKVPQRLHTPLMSMTNAISASTIIAALLLFSSKMDSPHKVLAAAAVALAAFNVVGGFTVTGRMLKMFKKQ